MSEIKTNWKKMGRYERTFAVMGAVMILPIVPLFVLLFIVLESKDALSKLMGDEE